MFFCIKCANFEQKPHKIKKRHIFYLFFINFIEKYYIFCYKTIDEVIFL